MRVAPNMDFIGRSPTRRAGWEVSFAAIAFSSKLSWAIPAPKPHYYYPEGSWPTYYAKTSAVKKRIDITDIIKRRRSIG